jgi:hypothetical protein
MNVNRGCKQRGTFKLVWQPMHLQPGTSCCCCLLTNELRDICGNVQLGSGLNSCSVGPLTPYARLGSSSTLRARTQRSQLLSQIAKGAD